MTYECISTDPITGASQYLVTFSFYRDCHGILPSTSMDVQITNSCGYPSQTVFIPQLGTEQDVLTTCPTAVTECHGGIHFFLDSRNNSGFAPASSACASLAINQI